MREIGTKIRQLDDQIAKKHNLIEHEINARLSEAQTTLKSTEQKIIDVQTAAQLLQQKLDKSEKLIDQLKIQESTLKKEKEKAQVITDVQTEVAQLRA